MYSFIYSFIQQQFIESNLSTIYSARCRGEEMTLPQGGGEGDGNMLKEGWTSSF